MTKSLTNTVIKNDFCVGCGNCAFVNPNKYQIKFDNYGMLKAHSSNQIQSAIKVLASNPDFRKKISDNNFKLSSQLKGWDTYGKSWRELLFSM